jgi:hypothetical protein
MAEQLREFLSGVLRHWILCSVWEKWIRNPTTQPWSVWRRCNETMERELRARRPKPPVPLSSWSLRQTVCSTFTRSGWSVVRSASLTKGGTSSPSPYLHKVPTRSNKVSPRTLQTALVLSQRLVQVFWVVTPCSVAVGHRRFGRPCCLNIEATGSPE